MNDAPAPMVHPGAASASDTSAITHETAVDTYTSRRRGAGCLLSDPESRRIGVSGKLASVVRVRRRRLLDALAVDAGRAATAVFLDVTVRLVRDGVADRCIGTHRIE
jgi:hypothetical protein